MSVFLSKCIVSSHAAELIVEPTQPFNTCVFISQTTLVYVFPNRYLKLHNIDSINECNSLIVMDIVL